MHPQSSEAVSPGGQAGVGRHEPSACAAPAQVLRKANVDVAAAAEELAALEVEHAAQQKATAAARKPKPAVRPSCKIANVKLS